MYPFRYTKPVTLEQAAKCLAAAEDGVLLAGGQTLLPAMKQRLAQPSDLIDLGGIESLAGIERAGDTIVIGAMTPHCDVASSSIVGDTIPGLAELAGGIGDPQVRNCGTLGGSVANADPAADYPAALVALGATVRTNEREIPAESFFTGMFETALDDSEIVTSVVFPIPARAAYGKFPNPASRYAVAGVFVAEGGGGVRVAVTGAGPSVFRVPAMEAALSGRFEPEAVAAVSIAPDDLNFDIHASAEYRAHLVAVMAKRATAAAAARNGHTREAAPDAAGRRSPGGLAGAPDSRPE